MRKEREEIFANVEVPILVCLPLVGDAWGYHPCATVRQENPLIWEPSLQHHKIGKKTGSSCPPHKSLHTSNNTSDSIKSHVQLPQAIIILFIVFVKGEWLENVQLGKVFTTARCRKYTLTNYLTCLPFDCLKISQKFLFDTRWMSDTSGIHNMPYYVYGILDSTLCTH